jgi:hypothetical protein
MLKFLIFEHCSERPRQVRQYFSFSITTILHHSQAIQVQTLQFLGRLNMKDNSFESKQSLSLTFSCSKSKKSSPASNMSSDTSADHYDTFVTLETPTQLSSASMKTRQEADLQGIGCHLPPLESSYLLMNPTDDSQPTILDDICGCHRELSYKIAGLGEEQYEPCCGLRIFARTEN